MESRDSNPGSSGMRLKSPVTPETLGLSPRSHGSRVGGRASRCSRALGFPWGFPPLRSLPNRFISRRCFCYSKSACLTCPEIVPWKIHCRLYVVQPVWSFIWLCLRCAFHRRGCKYFYLIFSRMLKERGKMRFCWWFTHPPGWREHQQLLL